MWGGEAGGLQAQAKAERSRQHEADGAYKGAGRGTGLQRVGMGRL